MPSVSKTQQHLFQAAEHGADFPMAKEVRSSMSHDQMHDFAVGSEADKPEHVFKASIPSSIHMNRKVFKARGQSEADSTRSAIQLGKKSHRPSNLGEYLHKKKNS